MLRRHPVLISAIALLLLFGAGLGLMAAYLDGEKYRERLQSELSAALGHPVRLGQAAFTLRRGPALAVSDLHIDAEKSGFVLESGLLYLRLEWASLLRGEIEFSRILLIRPRLRVILLPDGPETPAPLAHRSRSEILRSAVVSSLTVEKGQVLLEDRRHAGRISQVAIDEIQGEIADFGPERSAWLRLTARLPSKEGSSPLFLAGELTLPDPASWHRTRMRLGLLAEEFDLRLLEDLLPLPEGALVGKGRLELTLDGAPSDGLRATLRLGGAELALLPPWGEDPVALPPLELSTIWVAGQSGHLFRDLSLTMAGITLHGEMAWEGRGEESRIEARLHSAPTAISSLDPFLPERVNVPGYVASGAFEIVRLEFAAETGLLLRDPSLLASSLTGEAILHDATMLFPAIEISQIRADLRLEEGRLLIEEGHGSALEAPWRFHGAIEEIFSPSRALQAEAEGRLPAENLLPILPPQIRDKVQLEGAVPLTVSVRRENDVLRLDADADLEDLSARWEPAFVKETGRRGALTVCLQAREHGWILDYARLSLPGADLRANGIVTRDGEDVHLDIHLEAPELRDMHSLIPPLERIDARGGAAIRGGISRSDSQWRSEGILYLRSAGLRPGVVAEINDATGSIRLTHEGAQIKNMTARLGASPARVEGGLENFLDPVLRLHVRSDAVRADEIIFPSATAVLRDLDGHLTIERDRVGFSPVRVRLERGTVAVVRGEVVDFSNPRVELDIRADYGDIDEVIALWAAPGSRTDATQERRDHSTRVRISAAVAEGRIGNLKFEQAEGIISWEQGLLTIHPLHFLAAQGFCTGRVQVESSPQGHHLSVSGHFENAEAAELQQELLLHRGLISGTVRGDFFIEGEIGVDFRGTSRGGVHLEVEKGVLRRFNSLSKIFSILNVSQIFSGQFPDMAREGMPFNRINATFSLDQGILQTEDLLIDSNAMNLSLVGQVDISAETINTVVAVNPLRTVDKIVSRIPIAGWVLAGDEKALITAHFQIRGPLDSADVVPIPVTSLSEKAIGIFRRLFGLPAKFIENLEEMVRSE